MANKGTTMNIIFQCTIADNQLSATVDSVTVEGNYSDPAAPDPAGKKSKPIPKALEAYVGGDSCDTMVANCLTTFKGQIGI